MLNSFLIHLGFYSDNLVDIFFSNIMRKLFFRPACLLHPSSRLTKHCVIQNFKRTPKDITIGRHSYVNGRLILYAHGGSIRIGDYCFVGLRSEIWSMNSIIIGDRVLISHDVNIHDGTGHSLDHHERSNHFYNIIHKGHPISSQALPGVRSQPVVIEDDVWISFGVTILKGVRIGKGSVISAGSTVVKDVPPFSLYLNKVCPTIIPLKKS